MKRYTFKRLAILLCMEEERIEKLQKLYGALGQVLDGLWFTVLEKAVGFEKAYEVDDEVWRVYSRKEAKRLRSHFGFTTPGVEDIKNVLRYSLFAQSLEFELEVVQNSPLVIRLIISSCKTYSGMVKIGRPEDQAQKICKGIGLTYFGNLMDEISPGVQYKCIYTPYTRDEGYKNSFVWEFTFPNLSV